MAAAYGLARAPLIGLRGWGPVGDRGRSRWRLSCPNGTLRVMAELPLGTVTFLFTDLESSTRLWEELPEGMSVALARHDEILREAVEDHEGIVLARMGDGIAAVFVSAPNAVAAAVEVQRRLGAEPWPETGPLRARMGLHT